MVEYGLVLVLIALVVLGVMSSLGGNSVKRIYDKIEKNWPKA